MSDLREAAQQALDWLYGNDILHPTKVSQDLRAALEQAEPEPVAWMCPEDPERETAFSWKAGHCENCGKQRIPLYTAPPQRKPLTDDEILEMVRAAPALGSAEDEWLHVARAIERAHGIGEGE